MVTPSVAAAIALLSLLFWSEAAQAKTYWYCQFTPFAKQNGTVPQRRFRPDREHHVGGR
jgi:hypothetical protein